MSIKRSKGNCGYRRFTTAAYVYILFLEYEFGVLS